LHNYLITKIRWVKL